MKELRQITVIGMGLLGASITSKVMRSMPGITAVGFAHRASTRRKAKKLGAAHIVTGDIKKSLQEADLVILSTPISKFEQYLAEIAKFASNGCIVTDVGSTKTLPVKSAQKLLPKGIFYVGSHPIAGSEQRGVEFSRDDLFDSAVCILTLTVGTNKEAAETVKKFWQAMGCIVKVMSPLEHDRIFGQISHVPHITAASLVNASDSKIMAHAGKGFLDTSRIASGPANIWSDIFLTNIDNCVKGIDKIVSELLKLRKAIKGGDRKEIERLLDAARNKRNKMIAEKIRKKELIS